MRDSIARPFLGAQIQSAAIAVANAVVLAVDEGEPTLALALAAALTNLHNAFDGLGLGDDPSAVEPIEHVVEQVMRDLDRRARAPWS